MPGPGPLQGDLQLEIMRALWRLDRGRVDDVRGALPDRHRSAYNTVQTVLNRLTERGLLTRKKSGTVYVYAPRISEAEYYSRVIESTLSNASSQAREMVIAKLVSGLDAGRLTDLRGLADQADN